MLSLFYLVAGPGLNQDSQKPREQPRPFLCVCVCWGIGGGQGGNCIFKWVLSQRTGAGTESQRAGVRDQERRAWKPGWAYGRRAATRSGCSCIGGKNTLAAAGDDETAVRATAVVL